MSGCEFFTVIKDISVAGAAGVTAYVAWHGLERWRAELAGKASFETARALIRATYKLRDEIHYCRSPFISASEFPEGYRGALGRADAQQEGDAFVHVYSNRWEPVGEAIQQFDAATLEAEALWGRDVKEKAQEFRHLARRLQVSIESFIRNKYSGGENFKDREFGERVNADINESRMESDTLSPLIDSAVEALEVVLRPHLSRN
jgi:hypothetical protein